MSVADNFDYSLPTNCRKDLMSLSTINANDAKIHPFKKMDTQRDWSANLYNRDIEKAYPAKINYYFNKTDFINKVDDIEKTNPKILHYPLNKPEYNLSNDDIEKSKPKMGYFKTARCTNPLEPKYNLPKTTPYPPPVPKFIRDQIDISDIQGTKPKRYLKYEQRETFPINNGVEGSRPKKTYVRTTPYEYIDYSDLTKEIFKTKRHTSPLDPIYEMKYPNGECYVHGMIEKSKPQTMYPFMYPEPFNLRVNDINGAQAGTKNPITRFNGCNFNMNIKDIKEAQVGSLKKGIVTERNTNPLVPKYQYLGAKEKLNGNAPPSNAKKVPVSARPSIRSHSKPCSRPCSNPCSKPVSKPGSKPPTPDYYKAKMDENLSTKGSESRNNFLEDYKNVKFNKSYYHKPDPNFGLIHDRYVYASENPEKRPIIAQNKADNLTSNIVKSMSGQIKPIYNQEGKELTQNQYDGSIPMTQNLHTGKIPSRTCYSAFPNKGLTYAQKLDQFMDDHKLNYIGEPAKLKN